MMRVHHVLAVCFLIFSRAALAQEPTPTPRDSTPPVVAPDTGARTFQDSVRAIPQLTSHYFSPALGFSNGVWEWDQTDFELQATTSLADFLRRIPSIFVASSGLLVQPV